MAWIGYYLISETPGANPLLVLLFALLHDSMRVNDGTDAGHGKRAAAFAEDLFLRSQGRAYDLPDEDLHLLMDACARHTDGQLSDDPTVAVCGMRIASICGASGASRSVNFSRPRPPNARFFWIGRSMWSGRVSHGRQSSPNIAKDFVKKVSRNRLLLILTTRLAHETIVLRLTLG